MVVCIAVWIDLISVSKSDIGIDIEKKLQQYASLQWIHTSANRVLIGSSNGLSPVQDQAITRAKAGLWLIGPRQ